jgi:hypothetical protein
MELELRYGYVKFISDTKSPTYILVCIEAMKKYFDEFKTIDQVIPELSMEYYDNLMVINCMPIKMLIAFKILVRFITMREVVCINDVDEQMNLLLLLCKLANKQQIHEILDSFDINCEVWVRFLDENFDAKNFFGEGQKINICTGIAEKYPELDKEKYLTFYGIPYFDNLPEYDMEHMTYYLSYKKLCKRGFPQKRVYDKISKNYYQTLVLGDKVLLFNRHDSEPITKKVTFKTDHDLSDDERNLDISNAQFMQLPSEIVKGSKIYNFATDIINVHFVNKIIPMRLVVSSYASYINGILKKYKSDYDRLKLDQKYMYVYHSAIEAAIKSFRKNFIYVPPTVEIFESLLENAHASDAIWSVTESNSNEFD